MNLSEITKQKDKIEYDPSIMWLDYHTLLLKAKKKYYVEEKVNSSVFENKIAQHALFGKEDHSNATLFDMAIGGNVFIIYSLAENFLHIYMVDMIFLNYYHLVEKNLIL